MSGPPGSPPSALGRHPPALLDAERSYLAPWGRREVAWSVLGTAAAGLLVWLGGLWFPPLWALLLPVAALGALLVLFFRNPRRRVPRDGGLLVSPADGRVLEVSRVEE